MRHTIQILTSLVMGGFLLSVIVLGGYLAFGQVDQENQAETPASQLLSCEQILARLADQTELADCSNLPDSSACYGHSDVQVEQQGSEPVMFNVPGDQELLRKLRAISTGPLDLATGEWGVALLRTRLAENGQPINAPPVVFMLYGAATLENRSQETGAPANETTLYGMHAFYFDTRGLGLTPECQDLPVGGVAVESPDGYSVSFTANEVEIVIGSTVVLQAVPYADMHVTVLDGHAHVSAAGGTVDVGVGQEAVIPLGGTNGLQADQPPQVRNASRGALALPQMCQLASWGGIALPCAIPSPQPSTPTPTPIPTPTVAATLTPVPSPVGPFVTANVNANVRTGDDTVYDVVGALLTGQTAPVLGVSCTGSGWYVIPINGRQGFISPVVVTLTGSTAGLACVNPPPRDSDRDGFIDTVDRCPTLYAPNSTDGCPPPTPTNTPPAAPLDLVVYLADGSPDVDCSYSSPPVLSKQGQVECVTAMEITVRNISKSDARQAFTVQVTGTGGGYWSTTINGLLAGQSVRLIAVMDTSCYQPDCTITAFVDAGYSVPEINETNNTASRTWIG